MICKGIIMQKHLALDKEDTTLFFNDPMAEAQNRNIVCCRLELDNTTLSIYKLHTGTTDTDGAGT